MDSGDAISIQVLGDLKNIDRDAWNVLANPAGAPFDPFLSWDFLQALEESGCATAAKGLAARASDRARRVRRGSGGHAALRQGSFLRRIRVRSRMGRCAACVVAASITQSCNAPCRLPRCLAGASLRSDPRVESALAQGAIGLAQRAGASSVHATFADEALCAHLKPLGYLTRTGIQYHWFNQDYASFADFLGELSSQKRKTMRRERERASEGLTIRRLRGDEITPRDWDFFFRCYQDTGSRKWGSPYLNREFFKLLGERMGDACVLFLAEEDGHPLACALNLIGGEALYGRYWGRIADVPFLHFELCYYQAIDLAIELKLARVEAGAQGDHKLARGYVPAQTFSAHWIGHTGLRDAVRRYLDAETPAVVEEAEVLAEHTPFKQQE